MALPFKLRKLEAQSYTMREGDRPDRCAILLSGFAFRHKLTGDGSRQIMSIHIPGEALDFQNMFLSESDHNVQMLTRGTSPRSRARRSRSWCCTIPTSPARS